MTDLTVYAATASGKATPSATIAGSNTGLSYVHSVAVDASGKIDVMNPAGATGTSITIMRRIRAEQSMRLPYATITGIQHGTSGTRGPHA